MLRLAALCIALLLPSIKAYGQDAVEPAPVPPATAPPAPISAATHGQEAPASPATTSPPASASPQARAIERWVGPLVLGAGGLALVIVALVGAAQVGCDATTCTQIDPFPFTVDLVGGCLLLAGAIAWWLLGGDHAATTAPASMRGAGDVI